MKNFSFVIAIPTVIGIAGTLLGYHLMIAGIISADVPVDIIEEAEHFKLKLELQTNNQSKREGVCYKKAKPRRILK